MASYSYTRDMKDEDLAPPEVHVYTKKELWDNWWDYNLRWVIVGAIAAAVLIYLLLDIFVLTPDIDYQLAIVSPTSISESILTDMEDAITAMGNLTGKTASDDIVSRLFQRFCVGK